MARAEYQIHSLLLSHHMHLRLCCTGKVSQILCEEKQTGKGSTSPFVFFSGCHYIRATALRISRSCYFLNYHYITTSIRHRWLHYTSLGFGKINFGYYIVSKTKTEKGLGRGVPMLCYKCRFLKLLSVSF